MLGPRIGEDMRIIIINNNNNNNIHAERILSVKTISLATYSMHDSYRMSPKDIRRKGLGEEVRSLLRCRHVDQLYLLSGYLVANPVVLDIDVQEVAMLMVCVVIE